jgi:hypothetical protein
VQFDNIKPLQPHHVEGARLFSDRYQLMLFIRQRMQEAGVAAPSIVEIGVGFGHFSKFLIQAFTPGRFAALDVFRFHTYDELWGINVAEQLKGRLHVDYFRDEISAIHKGELIIEEGDSAHTIKRLEDASYDIVYVDAGHTYQEVIRDGREGLRKVRPGGYLVFNDYTMTDHLSRVDYGVVKAANEIINEDDRLKVVGFAFEVQMFCDLAVHVRA